MKVGDLVKYGSHIGIILESDVEHPDFPVGFHKVFFAMFDHLEPVHPDNLEVINEKR